MPRWASVEGKFPKSGILKKYLKKLANSQGRRVCCSEPQTHHNLTTKTPQKTITKHPFFSKTLRKTPNRALPKKKR
jgi:hypothetical protein